MIMSVRIKIISIGRPKQAYLREGIRDYLSRLKHYVPVEVVEIRDLGLSNKLSEEERKKKEGGSLLSRVAPSDTVIALDPGGKLMDTAAWAGYFRDLADTGRKSLIFLIGGELGLSDEVLRRADAVWSLSPLTFTHDMTRLILLEQIYRVMTILAGQKYHK